MSRSCRADGQQTGVPEGHRSMNEPRDPHAHLLARGESSREDWTPAAQPNAEGPQL